MEGRERVRSHLGRGRADRPPLILFATDFAARLEQVERSALWADVNLLTRALIGLQSLFGLDAIVLDLPPAALQGDQLPAASDAIGRLHTIVDDKAALVIALPGPLCRARDGAATLEELGDQLVRAAQELGPARADCLAIVERATVTSADAVALEDALMPIWNAARYYDVASLLVAAEGVPELGDTDADAVAVWAGASADELAERGSDHVGVPVQPGAAELPRLPEGAFYISRGELPATTDIDSLHRLIAAVGR